MTVGELGSCRKVEPEPNDDTIAISLQQDTCDFFPEQEKVVRPLEHHRLRGHRKINRLGQRQPGGERQALGWRIGGPKPDERASMEIAGSGNPRPALTSLPGMLIKRHQPLALDRLQIGNQIGVGRSGPVDDSDTAQKRLPAARSAREPSGPIRR